jgi:hypothetical protein
LNTLIWNLTMQSLHIRLLKRVAHSALMLAIVAACQTQGSAPPKVSLEEAKQITATFSDSLEIPPRNIDDIFALLDKIKYDTDFCQFLIPPSPGEVRAAIKSAPPPTIGRWLGPGYASDKAIEQFYEGNTQLSIKYMQWAIDEVPYSRRGVIYSGGAGYMAQLASFHAYAGEFDISDKILGEAVALQDRAKSNWQGSEVTLAWINFHVAESKGTNAATRGNLVEAEAYRRDGRERYKTTLTSFSTD